MAIIKNEDAVQLNKKRSLGIYYTPGEIADVLCSWAILRTDDTILEPSFGGCGFLDAACRRLGELGVKNPIAQLYGCDVDADAFDSYLEPKYNTQQSFLRQDFLRARPEHWGVAFDAVLGNPPYVRSHMMPMAQRRWARKLDYRGLVLDRKAGLWAYFILHSFHFLKRGGRMAWVLPGSYLHADYAAGLREIISDRFERVLTVRLTQRLFRSEGTEENSVVLLADGFENPKQKAESHIGCASSVATLRKTIRGWHTGALRPRIFRSRQSVSFLSGTSEAALNRIRRTRNVQTMGDLADVVIGIVTGSNKFFILNREDSERLGICDQFLSPIFSRMELAPGIEIGEDDLEQGLANGCRALLIDTSKGELTNCVSLAEYLKSYPDAERIANITFQKRGESWHRPNDKRVPDAFFPYLQHRGPRVVVNTAGVICTNGIHRVFIKDTGPSQKRFLSKTLGLSMLSTFSQLSAELQGRVYGSGALKHEPSEVRRIELLTRTDLNPTNLARYFRKANEMLKQGKQSEAQDLADQVFAEGLEQEVLAMRRDLERIRTLRRGMKDKGAKK